MNIKSAIDRATAFYFANDFSSSLDICHKVLSKNKKTYEARYLQALNYQGIGENDLALEGFNGLLKTDPGNSNVLNCIANTYIAKKEFHKAKDYCLLALKREVNFAEAINNLAICEQSLGDVKQAEAHYKKAIFLKGDELSFKLNLGKLYKDLGWFEKSAEIFVKAMDFEGDKSSVYFNLYENFMYMHKYEDALEIADLGLVSNQLKDIDLIELLVGKAILFWLFDNIDEAEQAILLSEGVYAYMSNSYANLDNLKIFHKYIKSLIAFHRANPELYLQRDKDWYFVSESHGFSPNNMKIEYEQQIYNIRSLFIKGAKVFHLTQENDNRFKQSLLRVLAGLPEKSRVVFAFGEIDCRYNEGILKYCLAKKKNYQDVISSMLDRYIKLLLTEGAKNKLEIALYGVPAPHPEQLKLLSNEEQAMLKGIVKHFNCSLKELCIKHSLLFLDVYQLTNSDGISNLEYHIDDIHVHPCVVPKLFDELK